MSSIPAASASSIPDGGGRMPALDGLRGLAVLMVLLDHASDSQLRLFPAADMNRAGKYGVYLFFVLSAFLLTHLLLRRPATELTQGRTWAEYFLRRFLRIFPLYAVVLIVMVINKFELRDLFTHLLLLDGKKQFWTIPVEVKYYLILPAAVLAISGFLHRQWRLAMLGTVGTLAAAPAVFAFEAAWSYNEAVLLARNLEPFLLGTAGALVHRALLSRPAGAARFAALFEAGAVVALIATAVRLPAVYNTIFSDDALIRKFAYDSLVSGLLWSVVLLGVLHGSGFVARVMETAVLRFLGLVSYSAYLWHQKFLTDVDDMPVPAPVRLLLFLLLVIGVASISYFLIERPLSRLHYRGKPHASEGAPPVLAAELR